MHGVKRGMAAFFFLAAGQAAAQGLPLPPAPEGPGASLPLPPLPPPPPLSNAEDLPPPREIEPLWEPIAACTKKAPEFVGISNIPYGEIVPGQSTPDDYLSIGDNEAFAGQRPVDEISMAEFVYTACPRHFIGRNVLLSRHELSEAVNVPSGLYEGFDPADLRKAYGKIESHFCTADEVRWVEEKRSFYPASTAACPTAF